MKGLRHLLVCGCMIACMSAMTLFASAVTPGTGTVDPSSGEGIMPVTITRDPARFNVTVPTSLPVHVDKFGKVTVSPDVKIINNSYGDVYISQIQLNGKNNWTLTDWYAPRLSLDYKTFAFQVDLNGKLIRTSQNAANETIFIDSPGDSIIIPGLLTEDPELSCILDMNYDAQVSPQTKDIDSLNIADIVFTVGWAEGD